MVGPPANAARPLSAPLHARAAHVARERRATQLRRQSHGGGDHAPSLEPHGVMEVRTRNHPSTIPAPAPAPAAAAPRKPSMPKTVTAVLATDTEAWWMGERLRPNTARSSASRSRPSSAARLTSSRPLSARATAFTTQQLRPSDEDVPERIHLRPSEYPRADRWTSKPAAGDRPTAQLLSTHELLATRELDAMRRARGRASDELTAAMTATLAKATDARTSLMATVEKGLRPKLREIDAALASGVPSAEAFDASLEVLIAIAPLLGPHEGAATAIAAAAQSAARVPTGEQTSAHFFSVVDEQRQFIDKLTAERDYVYARRDAGQRILKEKGKMLAKEKRRLAERTERIDEIMRETAAVRLQVEEERRERGVWEEKMAELRQTQGHATRLQLEEQRKLRERIQVMGGRAASPMAAPQSTMPVAAKPSPSPAAAMKKASPQLSPETRRSREAVRDTIREAEARHVHDMVLDMPQEA